MRKSQDVAHVPRQLLMFILKSYNLAIKSSQPINPYMEKTYEYLIQVWHTR